MATSAFSSGQTALMMDRPASTTKPIAGIFLLGGMAWLLAVTVRYRLVEYEPVWTSCAAQGPRWYCTLRTAINWGVELRLYESLSIVAGIGAVLTRHRGLAALALCAGIIGAVLYRFELSALGILAGSLVLAGMRFSPEQRD